MLTVYRQGGCLPSNDSGTRNFRNFLPYVDNLLNCNQNFPVI